MKKRRPIIGIVVLLTLVTTVAFAAPAATTTVAQGDMASQCPAITLKALESTQAICSDAANNEVCYGHVMLDAQPQPNVNFFEFDTEGDIASVTDMASLRLSAMDTEASLWGVALMRLQVNLLNDIRREPVMVLLFGDVEISNRAEDVPSVTIPSVVTTRGGANAKLRSTPGGTRIAVAPNGTEVTATGRTEDGYWIRVMLDTDRSAWIATILLDTEQSVLDTLDVVESRSAIYAPMQAFYMESGQNDAACPEAPNSGLMIQTPEGVASITFLINEVDIQLGSTVFFQASAGKELTVSVVEGSATVTAKGVSRKATTGSQISVPLDETGSASAIPSLPRPYDWGYVMALPTTYMDEPVPVAEPISEGDLRYLLANQPGIITEPVIVTTIDPVTGETVTTNTGGSTEEETGGSTGGGNTGQSPTPAPTDPPPPTPGEELYQVCHNGKTLTVSKDGYDAHLAHGDSPGACPPSD